MQLELSEELAVELKETVDAVIGDMSSEIADTDNAAFHRQLEARRERLRAIVAALGS